MSFLSLQHMQETKVHRSQVLPTRDVPPSGFGYPRDGLLPSHPRRFCFTPAALMGLTLRSVFLQGGSRRVSATMSPRAVGSLDISLPKQGPAQTNLDFWVLTLPRVPHDKPRVWHGHRRRLPWDFALPGHAMLTWTEPSPDLPSHAFEPCTRQGPRRRRVSIDQHSASSLVRLGRGRTKPPA
jgi:hypothetical protein